MSFYSDKLARVQVVINFWNIDAQMCIREDGLAYTSGARSIDDVMSYSDKLAHVQVVNNWRNTDAQMCTCEGLPTFRARRLLMMSWATARSQQLLQRGAILKFKLFPPLGRLTLVGLITSC